MMKTIGADGYICTVYEKNEREPNGYKYVYIIVNCNEKILLARKKESFTFEAPGGHCEAGELIKEAAIRELYEETGIRAETEQLEHIFDYHAQTQKNMTGANTAVFYIDITVENIPLPPIQFEMEETKRFDSLPEDDRLSYPTIAKCVYEHYKKRFIS